MRHRGTVLRHASDTDLSRPRKVSVHPRTVQPRPDRGAARKAPIGGTLVSALGGDEMTPSVGLVDLQPGDTLLLCTDGLTRQVSDKRIAEPLGRPTDAGMACRELVDEALAGGGHDNITVVAARMV